MHVEVSRGEKGCAVVIFRDGLVVVVRIHHKGCAVVIFGDGLVVVRIHHKWENQN